MHLESKMSARKMIIATTYTFFNAIVLISCQRQNQESTFESYSGSIRNKPNDDADAIVFPDLFENPTKTRLSQNHLSQPDFRIANSDRRSRPKSDQSSTVERRRLSSNYGSRFETLYPQNEYSRNKNYERTSISSTYESKRRVNTGAITFPRDYLSYSVPTRRPSHRRNDPSQLQRNEGNHEMETRPMIPTGQVPYSYLYKWVKQYHKNT